MLVILLASACGRTAAEPHASPPIPTRRAPEPAPVATTPAAAPAAPAPVPAPAPQPEKPAFPPADFEPPHQRSAQPGDGRWIRLGDAARGDRAAEGEALMVRTVVHPHPVSKWISVTVVAMDLERAALHLVAGTDEPISKDAPADLRTGVVPEPHRDSVVAVMNGGWKTAHGHWGMMAGGHTFVEPRPEGCTIAIFGDGQVRIRSWDRVQAQSRELEAWRQTPPCLLSEGELHPSLAAGQERAWGGMDPKLKTRRRSALGVDASGRVLFYGFGEEAGAKLLAQGMRAAGAVEAAELDINYSWTRYLLIGKPKPDQKLQVTSTLVPKMVHQKLGYVERPAPRDFFYLRRR